MGKKEKSIKSKPKKYEDSIEFDFKFKEKNIDDPEDNNSVIFYNI